MRTIKDFINEGSINEAKNSLGFDKKFQIPETMTLVDWTDTGHGVDFDDLDIDLDGIPDEALELFSEVFGQCIASSMIVELGNWFLRRRSDSAWESFYEETELEKGKDHGLVLHQDGDDADFTVLVFSKNIPAKYNKYMDDFKAMFSNVTVAEF